MQAPSTVPLRSKREVWVVAAGLLVLAPLLYALATVEALGLQDLPYHLLVARLAATAPQDLPAGVAHRQVPLLFPYHIIYPILGLGGRGGEHTVARILLLVYLIATTTAVVAVARQFRRFDPWNALAAIPVTVSMMFWSGFIVYLLAIPVFLWLLWAELRCLGEMDTKMRRRFEVSIAAGFLILYLLHPLVLLTSVWVGLTACAVAWRRRGTAHTLWPRLVGAALGLASTLLVVHPAVTSGTPLTGGGDDLGERVALLFGNTFAHFAPLYRLGAQVASALLLAGLFLRSQAVSRSVVAGGDAKAAGQDVDRTLVLAAAWGCCLVATLAIPFFAGPLAYGGTRFALPTLLLFVALLAGPLGPTAVLTRLAIATRTCAAALVFGGALLLSIHTAVALEAVSREIAPVRALGRTLARSGVVPTIVRITFEPRSSAVSETFCLGATAHVYALWESGAVDTELFDNPFLPVALVGNHPRGPNVFQPQRYDRRQARGATHVLLRLPGLGLASTSDSRRVVARLQRDFVLDSRAGPWLLWRRSALMESTKK